jgi:hypothetical protein
MDLISKDPNLFKAAQTLVLHMFYPEYILNATQALLGDLGF